MMISGLANKNIYICTCRYSKKKQNKNNNNNYFFPESSKLGRALLTVVKSVAVIGLWYVFICSLDLVGSAFHLLGRK